MRKLAAIASLLAAAVTWLGAQTQGSGRIPPGVVALHFTGRGSVTAAGVATVYGVFPIIDGIGTGLFSGDPDIKNAHFSFRSSLLKPTIVPNRSLVSFLSLAPVEGDAFYSVYFNANPSRDVNRPASFAEGDLIATFRARSASLNLMPHTGSFFTATLQIATSNDFNFRGRTYNLRNLVDMLKISAQTEPFPNYEFGRDELTFGYGGYGVAVQ